MTAAPESRLIRRRPRRERSAQDPEGRMPLISHLRELQRRLTRATLAIVICSIAAGFFYEELFRLITHPFKAVEEEYAEKGAVVTLNFQGVGDPFSYALKISLMAGVFAASPVWLYQLWAFVAPGLHRREKRYGIAFVAVSVPLFLGGAVLAYLFLPKGFDLLIGFNPAPERVANIISLNTYLSFVLRMFLVFGVAMVMPVFLLGLNLAGIVSGRALVKAWRPVVMGAFVFAAVATPSGDPYTMTALATPMLVLYFIAAGIALLVDRRRARTPVDGVDYTALSDEEASPLDERPTPLDERPTPLDDVASPLDDEPRPLDDPGSSRDDR